jgi:hypothetical protein
MPKMESVMVRARAYLRAIARGEVIFGPALLLVLLSATIVWVGSGSSSQEATGQEKAQEATIREAPAPAVAEPAAPLFPEFTLPDLPKDEPKAERRSVGIPGLGNMDVIGYVQYLPDTNFRCPGGGPAGGGLTKRVCTSSSAEDSTVLEVTLVEDNPSTVLWVRADALEATDEAAAEFLSYVARLSLEDTDPLNADTWIGENISSSAWYSAEGAELELYGTEGARTLEIVATGVPSDIVSEPSNRSGTKDRDRTPR